MTLVPQQPKLPANPPVIEFPPGARTREKKAAFGYRAQQRLLVENRCVEDFKDSALLAGYQKDWEWRLLRVQATINAYLDVTPITAKMSDAVADAIRAAHLARKMNAREDRYWDTRGLADHPIFVPKVVPLIERDPLEDFVANYTEVDAEADITVAQHSVTVDAMRRFAESYVYRDMGAGHFADLSHRFKATRTGDCNYCGLVCTATELDDFRGNTDCAGISVYQNTWYADQWAGGAEVAYDGANFTAVQDTKYYCKYSRAGSTVSCPISITSYDTPATDTVGIDDDGTARQYVFPVNNMTHPYAAVASLVVEDLDLQEGIARPKVGGSLAAGRAGLVR